MLSERLFNILRFYSLSRVQIEKKKNKAIRRMSIPVLLPLAMASRNLGTTAWSFTGPMPDAVTNADGRQFRCINLPSVTQPENRKNIWVRLVGKREMPYSSTTGLNPCVTMTERSSMRFRESRRVLYCALFLVLSVSACYFLIPLIFSILTMSGTALPCSKAS